MGARSSREMPFDIRNPSLVVRVIRVGRSEEGKQMGDRRPKNRAGHRSGDPPMTPDVFAECGLNEAEFEVIFGRGKSFLSGQRLVFMAVTHRPTGRKVSGTIGTGKKKWARQHDVLLRELLQSFRRS